MLDGRIYRAGFVPLLFVLAIAGFSLANRPGPLRSTLAPDAFNGARAFADLQALSKEFPDRLPGGPGDDRLAEHIARSLEGLGNPPTPPPTESGGHSATTAGGGFQVTTRQLRAQTIDGARTLTTVIAERPGSTGLSPIAIVAHRDAAARGSAAELSGTATLLELARVFSQSETRRTIVLASTSGGTGGDAGAADFARHATQPLDAAIALGDLAGATARKPFVLPFSSASGTASESLQNTLDAAIGLEVGINSAPPGDSVLLAHLALPLATGEEAPLNGAGVPSVLVQVSGERGPAAGDRVSQARLLNFGRAVLSATYALDEGPDIARSSTPRVTLGHKTLPAWAIRMLALALLLPPLLVSVDALARLRRRREPILRWIVWALSGALPFLTAALFAILLGALGVVASPSTQPLAGALSANGSAPGALASVALVLALSLLAWPALVRRLGLPVRPSQDGAALAVLLVLLTVALLAWLLNPFACLLIVPALHLWLAATGGARRAGGRSRALALCAILASVLPLALLLVIYSRELGIGPVGLSESAVLALAGGQLGLLAALAWSVALGCLLAVLALAPPRGSTNAADSREWVEISTRGPASYAGPGSLGGTESALRR
jgi:Peptidase family M28